MFKDTQYEYLSILYCSSHIHEKVHIHVHSGLARGKGKLPPQTTPGKFAKNGEQPRPQPAIRIDSSRKL